MKKLLIAPLVLCFGLLFVNCESEVTLTAPANFALTANTDGISVDLDWDASPTSEEVDGYYIYFNDVLLDSSTTNAYTHTDPQESGDYYVTAYQGETESEASTELTTVPVLTATTSLGEINAATESGFGWNLTSGQGSTFSMADETNAGDIDLYFTDWQAGYAGTYDIQNPADVVTDPGAGWLVGTTGWKVSGFIELTPVFDSVTTVPTTGYSSYLTVTEGFAYAVYTEDGHYGMVEVIDIDVANGTISVRGAFQTVADLAILQH
jgi:hypothetical protein